MINFIIHRPDHSRVEILQNCSTFFCQFPSWKKIWEKWEIILFHKIPTLDSDFVRVSASESVPQTILASQDNGENEQEIVDLTVETVNAVSTISEDANVTVTATPERVLKVR